MPDKEDIALIAHLMRRAGFGASRDALEARAAAGYEATVEELLHPEEQPAIDEDMLYRYLPGFEDALGPPINQAEWVYRWSPPNVRWKRSSLSSGTRFSPLAIPR